MKLLKHRQSNSLKKAFNIRKKFKMMLLIVLGILLQTNLMAQQGHFKIRSDEFVQIGYDTYKTLSFGMGGSTVLPHNNGHWAIEHWNGGFNIWRPWPEGNWGNYKVFIRDWDGYMGIGKYPYHKLDVDGDIATFGTVRITSDRRLKTNISNLSGTSCLTNLMNIQSVSYNYKYDRFPSQGPTPKEGELTDIKKKTIEPYSEDKGVLQSKIIRHGFLAQDIQKIFPDLVSEDAEGFFSIDYIAMIPIVVESIKEQQNKINQLEQRLKELERVRKSYSRVR